MKVIRAIQLVTICGMLIAALLSISGCQNHPVDCAVGFAWGDCKPGTPGYAHLQQANASLATAEKQQADIDDKTCKSYGLGFGTDAYANCRITLRGQNMQAREKRQAMAASILLSRPNQPTVTPTYPSSVSCTSVRNGSTTNTNCH